MLTLRDFRPEDFETLWRLDQRCFVEGISYSRTELRYYIDGKKTFTILAEDQKELLGFLIANHDRAGVGHIITIDVDPKQQRKGVGTALMGAAEERLMGLGCKSVLLETAVDNLNALAFYKRQGYSVLKTLPRYYMNSLDGLLMGKRIAPSVASVHQPTSNSAR